MKKQNLKLLIVTAITLLIYGITAGAQEPQKGPAGQTQGGGQPQDESKTVQISMKMQAGSGEYKTWPNGGNTMHSGVGSIEPFGAASYSCGMGYPEAAKFPQPDYFTDSWSKTYGTRLFCVYKLDDGLIFTYDGIGGNLIPDSGNGNKSDELVNVVVGGTGAYEGATGMWVGHTEGYGVSTEVAPNIKLPTVLLKIMEGYVKVPKKK